MKREEDNIFDALMLRSPTVNGLKEAIAEKFELDYNKISKVFTVNNLLTIFCCKNTNSIYLDLQKTETWNIGQHG